jgi:pimeloyl-ACP methyl ester carboxylesterase
MSLVPRPALVGAAVAALLALVPVTSASAADPTPFGHACTPLNGVRFCPTTDLASRPASFDGTPIDVDVTLPATGDGPFPTILLLHGLGGDKTSFESTTGEAGYNSSFFAQQGYAVVTPTARGFGNSCGKPESRTPDCAAGWTRLGDMRYEVRDIQTLVGQLVDQGVVNPQAIGATGISFGGGFSTMLAFLKDRVRLPDGSYAPWASPKGTPISLTAAWPRWLWSNGESIFTRNGRGPWSRSPTGVEAQAYAGGIFGVALSGFTAPTGGDLSTDLTRWKAQLDSGKLTGTDVQATLDNTYNYHGVANVSGTPSPLLLQSGWTDALFPVGQSLGAYDHIRAQSKNAPVALQVADLGHNPGANHPKDVAAFDAQGLAFLNAWLKGAGTKPAPGSVTAYTMTCPVKAAAGGGPYTASTFTGLAKKILVFSTPKAMKITSKGASSKLAAELSPLAATGTHCATHAVDKTSKAVFSSVSRGRTLIGQTIITGTVKVTGRYGQLDARLWDLNPKTGKQQLIDRGAYRLKDDENGSFRFLLDGNGWKFVKGHVISVELLGRDAPTYGASPSAFSAQLTKVKVSLPVR